MWTKGRQSKDHAQPTSPSEPTRVWGPNDFIDARAEDLQEIDRRDLRGVVKGDAVKVQAGGERFWITVQKVETRHFRSPRFTGQIDNLLECTDDHGMSFGEIAVVEARNVINIAKAVS